MTHAEAIAFICCLDGVPQDVVDALDDGLTAVERERDEARHKADTLRSDLALSQDALNNALGRLSYYDRRDAPASIF